MQRLAMPQPGTRWTGRRGARQETRLVVDSTLGNDVCYRRGDRMRYYQQWECEKCTLEEWHGWVEKTAARLRHSEKLRDDDEQAAPSKQTGDQ